MNVQCVLSPCWLHAGSILFAKLQTERGSDPERARSVTAEWDKVEIEWMGIVLRAGRQERRAEREGEEGGLADVRPEGYVQNRPTSACEGLPHIAHTLDFA